MPEPARQYVYNAVAIVWNVAAVVLYFVVLPAVGGLLVTWMGLGRAVAAFCVLPVVLLAWSVAPQMYTWWVTEPLDRLAERLGVVQEKRKQKRR